nr:hypothetical protein [Tanacetum cinerariifolium]GFB47165.1 hypothetical protein [Tanacetum cinerariifolium]
MKAIQDVIAAKTILPKTYREIFDEVLKSTNHAHVAGVGRQLAGMGNLDSGRSQPDTGYYTQERLEDLKRQHALEIEEQRKAFESQENVLKKFMDFFNRQQGLLLLTLVIVTPRPLILKLAKVVKKMIMAVTM